MQEKKKKSIFYLHWAPWEGKKLIAFTSKYKLVLN